MATVLNHLDGCLFEEVWLHVNLQTLFKLACTCTVLHRSVASLPPAGKVWQKQWHSTSLGELPSHETPKQRCIQVLSFDMAGRWLVTGRYGVTPEETPYEYYMELETAQPETPARPMEQWFIGAVTTPWRFRITGKRARNQVGLQQRHDEGARFTNLSHETLRSS
eukprot:TRINITY_DN51521_c0_g1_i1.p1 TRINITY_DN51521_c0_g1~~TRINITY_DN51521_c0_g1_i1.p1  ORF type:complete len:165 (+),score=14.93 TRINITY_DN51521_c0_g1_i1:123-617(+)